MNNDYYSKLNSASRALEKLRRAVAFLEKENEALRARNEHLLAGRTLAENEVQRLRRIIVQANNTYRHDFFSDVDKAVDRLFKRLSVYSTDPFCKRKE